MDLDQTHDWPGLNQKTFRSANHTHRVRIAEWIMFQLFDKWDPEEAKFVRDMMLFSL